MSLAPFVHFTPSPLAIVNRKLEEWSHKMGPFNRPYAHQAHAWGLWCGPDLVAVAVDAPLVREHVGGADEEGDTLAHLTRANTVELARLCAARPGLCRGALRLWREFAFPALGVPLAISYQDTDQHNGATYRFDGFERIGYSRAGGTDSRSGRKGRNKAVWAWPRGMAAKLRSEALA